MKDLFNNSLAEYFKSAHPNDEPYYMRIIMDSSYITINAFCYSRAKAKDYPLPPSPKAFDVIVEGLSEFIKDSQRLNFREYTLRDHATLIVISAHRTHSIWKRGTSRIDQKHDYDQTVSW